MSSHRSTEVLVGAAVIAVAAGFLIYAAQVAGISTGSAGLANYTASFRSVQGIAVGTDVRMAGVKVGTVTGLALEPDSYRAETAIAIDEAIELTDDTAIVIASEGLLGGNFVELVPGGSPIVIEPGGEIYDTQGAISLIALLTKFVAGGGDEE